MLIIKYFLTAIQFELTSKAKLSKHALLSNPCLLKYHSENRLPLRK